MQVECNEQVFSPKPEKNFAQICLVVFEKNKNEPLIPKNDVTEPKARLLLKTS